VDADGLVTGLTQGQTTVTASAGEVSGASEIFVFDGEQKSTVRVTAPAVAQVGETFQVQLVVDLSDLPGLLGAVATSLTWDQNVLALEDWDTFSSDHWWNGVRWPSSGKLATVTSAPDGLAGQAAVLQFDMRVIGGAGSQTAINLSLDQAVAALTFLDLGPQMVATGTTLTIQ
jgi:hypothetical protein